MTIPRVMIFLSIVVVLVIFAVVVGLPIYILVLKIQINKGGAELGRRVLRDLEGQRETGAG